MIGFPARELGTYSAYNVDTVSAIGIPNLQSGAPVSWGVPFGIHLQSRSYISQQAITMLRTENDMLLKLTNPGLMLKLYCLLY